ncbi:MAG: GldG family protein [Gammaproteobacteria bacterium]|nr:GldG family protein [Gammaproteobacteria bacterium]
MEVTAKSRLQLRIQFVLFAVLFITCIGLLAWLSTQYSFRSDWTAGNRNSLSDDTIMLLQKLEQPVQIRTYQPNDPTTQQAVNEILARYQSHNPNIQFKIINPDLEIDLAKADEISVYGQTVINYQNKKELLDSLNEQDITNALIRLSRNTQSVITFIQGHSERDPDATSNTGYSTLKKLLADKGFSIETVNLLESPLSKDIKILVIAAPNHKLLDGEVDQIINYINDGGNLLWLQDPGDLQNLGPLAALLQITFSNGVLVDNNESLRETLRIQHPAIIPVISYGQHKITEEIRYNTLFPISSAIKFKDDSSWNTTPLLITLPGSWTETSGFSLDVAFNPDKGDIQGPHTPGVALEKELDNDQQQRIVVIGDSDFLANTYIGAGANLSFTLNTLNWLNTDDRLMDINPVSAPDLTLELSKLETAAIGFGFMLILPIIFISTGIFIWLKRRNR